MQYPVRIALLSALALTFVYLAGGGPEARASRTTRVSPQEAALIAERRARPKPDHPLDADAWRVQTLRDEHGAIPHDALLRARAQATATGVAGQAGGLDSQLWSELGPGNLGGRVRSIAQLPSTANLFVGSVAGGLWKSPDSGATWNKVDDSMLNLAITSIAYGAFNPFTIYVGTGEGFGNTDAVRGAGIWKSGDGGANWARLAATNTPDFYYVNRLAVATDGQTVHAATGTGMWRSSDGGASWVRTYGGANTSCLDVRIHGSDNSYLVASVRDWDATAMTWYSASLFSTNGGTSWALSPSLRSNAFLDRVELAFARSYNNSATPGCVYALKAVGTATNLYRSTNGGATFQLVSSPPGVLSAGWYAIALWVDPADTNNTVSDDKLVIGGLDLWRSTNGGATFTKISDWTAWPNSAHADHHVLEEGLFYDGVNDLKVYVGNDGGVWRADNILTVTPLAGWTNLNKKLPITQFYGGARHILSNVLLGGTQDNGTTRYSGNPDLWTTTFGGDGGQCASDPAAGGYLYGEYIYLQLLRSVDAGASAAYVHAGIADAGDKTPNAQTANFVAPFALDPSNPNTLLAGGTSLWRSTNVKTTTPTWTAIKAPAGSLISAVAIAPSASNVAWVGHNNGDVYSTSNATAAAPTWTRRDTASPALPDRYVTRIRIDPANANRVFVTFGGFAADNVWQTTNGGTTWTAATGLPSAPVRDLEISEARGNWLYAATEVGLMVSENGGASWTSAATPANVAIEQLLWSGHVLYLMTHGRGAFRQLAYTSASSTNAGNACQFGGPVSGPALACTAPQLGATTTFTLTGGVVPGTAELYVSAIPPAPIQISTGCFVQIDPQVLVPVGAQPLSAGGGASWTIPWPDLPIFAGTKLMTQSAVVSTGTLRLSNGRLLTLGY